MRRQRVGLLAGVGDLVARMVRHETTPEDEDTLATWSPQRAFVGQEALR